MALYSSDAELQSTVTHG